MKNPDPDCAQCGSIRPVMLRMKRGVDGKEWSMCSSCWIEGTAKASEVIEKKKKRR